MASSITAPPDLLPWDGKNWEAYQDKLYRIFIAEIVRGELRFRGLPVSCRRHPETNERWSAFWHLTQEGPTEEERIYEPRRCERIRWIRWTIENALNHPRIDEWQNRRDRNLNTLLWYNEEYLVVLAQRQGYWLLATAYGTERRHTIRKLQKERNKFRQKQI